MASGGLLETIICPECAMKVEILNNDIQFSMNLHVQSHRSFETIDHEIDQQMENIRIGPEKVDKKVKTESVSENEKGRSSTIEENDSQSKNDTTISLGMSATMSVPQNLKSILESLPPHLKNTECIIEDKKGKIKCLTCNVIMPAIILKAHLLGKTHTNKSTTNKLISELPERSLPIKKLFQLAPSSLQNHLEFIQAVSKEKFSCSVCNLEVQAHIKCLREHLEGARHKKAVDTFKSSQTQEMKTINNDANKSDLLTKPTKSKIEPKNCAHNFVLNGDFYECKLCESKQSKTNDENIVFKTQEKQKKTYRLNERLRKNILRKIYDRLLERVESIRPATLTERPFIQITHEGLNCCVCGCHISSKTDFEGFKNEVLSHFKGVNHLYIRSYAMTGGIVSPSPLPFFSSNSLLDDMPFLKPSILDGCLSCTLCDTIIDPNFIREHRESENHIKKRKASGIPMRQQRPEELLVATFMSTFMELSGMR